MGKEESSLLDDIYEEDINLPIGIENIIQKVVREDESVRKIKRTSKVATKSKYNDRYKISKGKNKHGGSKRNFNKTKVKK